MFSNIPQVTKNLLVINILVFVLYYLLMPKGIDLNAQFSTHSIGSPLFKPYQVVTHMFAHDGFWHIFMNMWLFIMLGGYLEQLWGPKRFFTFFILCGLGAFVLQNALSSYQLFQLKAEISNAGFDINTIDYFISHNKNIPDCWREIQGMQKLNSSNAGIISDYVVRSYSSMLGASGAVFGVLSAFAILFPNREFLLYFAIPVKAKYLVGVYFLFEVYLALKNNPNDHVAHLAHIGGAIMGVAIVLYWRKTDRTNFY